MVWLVDQWQQWPTRISPRKSAFWGGAVAISAVFIMGCGSSGSPSVDATLSPEGQLAQHLTDTGAVMYGAYWCPHCSDQKAMFGDAVEKITYVECAEGGENAQPQLCQERGIQGFPTWEINGELHPGSRSLDELAALSDFQPSSQ